MTLAGQRVGVVLSSSFFGFYAHAGFLAGLDDLGIRPIGYAGTSAGALISAFAASGLSTAEMHARLVALKRSDFWDPDYMSLLLGALTGFRSWKGFLKGAALKDLVASVLPTSSFESCRTPCCIIATDLTSRTKAVFHRGNLVDAVCASGSVPVLFQPYEINQHLYVDGGLVEKAPLVDLYEMIRPDVLIVHYLPSSSLQSSVSLHTPFLPFRLNSITRDLARELHYQSQLRTLADTSCKVIAVSGSPPRVSPFSLHQGPVAYNYCRVHVRDALSGV